MIVEKPYFMNEQAWYYYDEEEFRYKLTAEATEKAKESYYKFYNLLDIVSVDQ